MTLHHLASNPLGALQMAASYIQGGFFAMGSTPDEEMQLEQDSDWPSVLILMQKGDERGILELNLDGAPLIVDNTASGLGGIDTGSVAADTVYDLRVVCNEAGDLAGLIATVSGAAPTIPAGYPWVSPVLAAGITDGTSDFVPVYDLGAGEYQIGWGGGFLRGIQVVTLGTGTATVDCSSALPEDYTSFGIVCDLENTNANKSVFNLIGDDGGALSTQDYGRINNLPEKVCVEVQAARVSGGPTNAFRYSHGVSVPTQGFNAYIRWFRIKRR